MRFKFTGDKNITRGIQEKLPGPIIDLLWMILEEKKHNTELDFLQTFKLETIGEGENKITAITHIQERPEPFADVHYLADYPVGVTGTVYIIDKMNRVTMLWSYENKRY